MQAQVSLPLGMSAPPRATAADMQISGPPVCGAASPPCPVCARLRLGASPSVADQAVLFGVALRPPTRYAPSRAMSTRELEDIRAAAARGACSQHLAQVLNRTPQRVHRELVRLGLRSAAREKGRSVPSAGGAASRGRRGLPSDAQIIEAAQRLCLAAATRTLGCGRAALQRRAAELDVTFQPYEPESDAPEMKVDCPRCGARRREWCVAVIRASGSGQAIHSFHKARIEIAPLASPRRA